MKTLMLVLLSVILGGCGGSELKEVIDDNKTPKVTVTGNSPLLNAKVTLSKTDGTQLATTSTDDNGAFKVVLNMSARTTVRIEVLADNDSQMDCLAVQCPGSTGFGQRVPSGQLVDVKLFTYADITPPENWETSEVAVQLTFVSSLTSVLMQKAFNQGMVGFNELALDSSAVILNILNINAQSGLNLLSFNPQTAVNQSLLLSNNALMANKAGDTMAYVKLSNWLQAMPLSQNIFDSSDAIKALMSIANTHANRSGYINDMLVFIPALEQLSIGELMVISASSADIDVTRLIESVEAIGN